MKKLFLSFCLLSSGFIFAQAGSLDTTFNPENGPNLGVMSVVLQPDNKILIGGYFKDYNGIPRGGVARLNENGSLDSNFNPVSGAINGNFFGKVYTIVLQSDRKILIGGEFSSYDGISRNGITRMNENGTIDTSFNPGTGFKDYGIVYTMAVQPDQKILVGGYFKSYNGISKNGIVRLNTDGSIDSSFNNIGTGTDDAVMAMAVQSDGKILIGGSFLSFNGTNKTRILRLNQDGSIDTSFEIGSGANDSISCIIVQNDGKILIGGQLTSYDGFIRNRIARLNQDGTIDQMFTNGITSSPNNHIESIVVQPNGKILVGGYLTKYNGINTSSISRLNTDGSLDQTFSTGTGLDEYNVNAIMLQKDAKIVIGGNFSSYNGVTRNRIARLLLEDDLSVENINDSKISFYPNPVENVLNINTENFVVKNITIYDMNGKIIMSPSTFKNINVNHLFKGNYILTVETDEEIKSFKFIKK